MGIQENERTPEPRKSSVTLCCHAVCSSSVAPCAKPSLSQEPRPPSASTSTAASSTSGSTSATTRLHTSTRTSTARCSRGNRGQSSSCCKVLEATTAGILCSAPSTATMHTRLTRTSPSSTGAALLPCFTSPSESRCCCMVDSPPRTASGVLSARRSKSSKARVAPAGSPQCASFCSWASVTSVTPATSSTNTSPPSSATGTSRTVEIAPASLLYQTVHRTSLRISWSSLSSVRCRAPWLPTPRAAASAAGRTSIASREKKNKKKTCVRMPCSCAIKLHSTWI